MSRRHRSEVVLTGSPTDPVVVGGLVCVTGGSSIGRASRLSPTTRLELRGLSIVPGIVVEEHCHQILLFKTMHATAHQAPRCIPSIRLAKASGAPFRYYSPLMHRPCRSSPFRIGICRSTLRQSGSRSLGPGSPTAQIIWTPCLVESILTLREQSAILAPTAQCPPLQIWADER